MHLHHFAVDPAQAGMDAEFAPIARQQLHADADAQERRALFQITLSRSASTMPGTARRPRMQSAKAPTPGSTMRSAWRTTIRDRR